MAKDKELTPAEKLAQEILKANEFAKGWDTAANKMGNKEAQQSRPYDAQSFQQGHNAAFNVVKKVIVEKRENDGKSGASE